MVYSPAAASPFDLGDKPDPKAKAELVLEPLRTVIRDCLNANSEWPLFVHGSSGFGKTMAAHALVAMYGGWLTDLSSLARLFRSVESGEVWRDTGPGSGYKLSFSSLMLDVARVRLMVIDEIATREPTAHQYEVLKRVLDHRVDRDPKPTMFISNVDLATLRRVYDDRILSRLTCGTVVEVYGPDRRLTPL